MLIYPAKECIFISVKHAQVLGITGLLRVRKRGTSREPMGYDDDVSAVNPIMRERGKGHG